MYANTIDFISKNNPHRFLISFDYHGSMFVEFFPNDYIGDYESGKGVTLAYGDDKTCLKCLIDSKVDFNT